MFILFCFCYSLLHSSMPKIGLERKRMFDLFSQPLGHALPERSVFMLIIYLLGNWFRNYFNAISILCTRTKIELLISF